MSRHLFVGLAGSTLVHAALALVITAASPVRTLVPPLVVELLDRPHVGTRPEAGAVVPAPASYTSPPSEVGGPEQSDARSAQGASLPRRVGLPNRSASPSASSSLPPLPRVTAPDAIASLRAFSRPAWSLSPPISSPAPRRPDRDPSLDRQRGPARAPSVPSRDVEPSTLQSSTPVEGRRTAPPGVGEPLAANEGRSPAPATSGLGEKHPGRLGRIEGTEKLSADAGLVSDLAPPVGGAAIGAGPGQQVALATPGGGNPGREQALAAYLQSLRQRIQESLRYPWAARRRGITGTVELEIAIADDGSVREVSVVRSSASRLLDEAAVDSVRRVRGVTPPRDLAPRELRVRVPVVFELR